MGKKPSFHYYLAIRTTFNEYCIKYSSIFEKPNKFYSHMIYNQMKTLLNNVDSYYFIKASYNLLVNIINLHII